MFSFLFYVTITYYVKFLLQLVLRHSKDEEGRFGPAYKRLIHDISTDFSGCLARKSLTLRVFSLSKRTAINAVELEAETLEAHPSL